MVCFLACPPVLQWERLQQSSDQTSNDIKQNANPSLFELGQAVSGTELIGEMKGTIVIDLADTGDE